MAKRNVKSLKLYISTVLKAINTLEEDEDNYKRFQVDQMDVPLPQSEQMSDAGTVGNGSGYEHYSWHYRWLPAQLPIRGKLEDTVFPILLARVLGGTVVDTAVTDTDSYDHDIPMANELELIEPKLFSVITEGQGAFIWGDMYVTELTISQNRDEHPTFEGSLANTGLFKKVADSSIVTSGVAAPPADYFGARYHGAATTFTYNNGTSQNLTASRGLISVSVKVGQPCDVVALPGDSFLTAGDSSTGSYAGTIVRQSQPSDMITLRYYADSALAMWTDMKASTLLTNVSITFRGKKIGDTTDNYETEFLMEKARVVSVTGSTEGEHEAFDVVIKAMPNAQERLCAARIRNASATLV